jgi:hypothetical protein
MNMPEIKCAHTAVWPVAAFKAHPRNPNKHPAEQLALIGDVIRRAGWRNSIVVSNQSGFVIKGHGRLSAALACGFTHAPVDLQDYDSDDAEMADMIADNRIASLAEINEAGLATVLTEINQSETNLLMSGFTEDAFLGLQAMVSHAAEGARKKVGVQAIQYNVIFDEDVHQQQWFSLLKHLKTKYPQHATPGGRLSAFITDTISAK